MSKHFGFIIAFCVVVVACHKTSEPQPIPDCSQISHTWSHDVVPLLTTYCTNSNFGGCHQSGSQYGDWTDYDQFKYKVDGGHVKEHCLDKDEMPPPYSLGPRPLKAAEKQMLQCWINDGALKN